MISEETAHQAGLCGPAFTVPLFLLCPSLGASGPSVGFNRGRKRCRNTDWGDLLIVSALQTPGLAGCLQRLCDAVRNHRFMPECHEGSPEWEKALPEPSKILFIPGPSTTQGGLRLLGENQAVLGAAGTGGELPGHPSVLGCCSPSSLG